MWISSLISQEMRNSPLKTLMRWYREVILPLDGFLKHTIAHLASNVTFAPQAYRDICLRHLTLLEVYKPLLFVNAEIKLIMQGRFAVDVFNTLTPFSFPPLLWHIRQFTSQPSMWMALFFQPPPPPLAPNIITLPPGADCDSYEQWIFKPLENALSSMAQSLQDLNDDPNEAHSLSGN